MGAAEDVRAQFIAENNTLYEGHPTAQRLVPDLRAMIKFLSWDLLRFQKPTSRKGGSDVDTPWGLRDSITRQHLVAEQNNAMLRKLCKKLDLDISDIPGA